MKVKSIKRFIIQGETPSKKNSRINTRSGRSFPSKQFTLWHSLAMAQINEQKKEMSWTQPISEKVNVFCLFTHGDKKRRDSDNQYSSISDLLVDSGILSDDNWQIVQGITIKNIYEAYNAHCQIIIEELEDE